MTTIELPKGFLTRPEAAKIFNRSQRALERDLDKALSRHDEKNLAHWKLITKDGTVREERGLSTKEVDQLVAAGMVPTWCVEVAWLEEIFGQKGTPKPQSVLAHDQVPPAQRQQLLDNAADSRAENRGDSVTALPADVEFLKERIRTLEREKREEVERNERREAKLFAELDVKNKQIAAWDEISQGLTRALATGQITPRLQGAEMTHREQSPANDVKRDRDPAVVPATVIQSGTASAGKEGSPVIETMSSPHRRKSAGSGKRSIISKKMAHSASRTGGSKWYDMPTFKRIFTRLL